jgi:hypothetical protein
MCANIFSFANTYFCVVLFSFVINFLVFIKLLLHAFINFIFMYINFLSSFLLIIGRFHGSGKCRWVFTFHNIPMLFVVRYHAEWKLHSTSSLYGRKNLIQIWCSSDSDLIQVFWRDAKPDSAFVWSMPNLIQIWFSFWAFPRGDTHAYINMFESDASLRE